MRFHRSLILVAFSFVSLTVLAQQENYFSADSEEFINQIQTYLLDTPNKQQLKQGEELMAKLKPRWDVGRFSKAEKDKIKLLSEQMRQGNLRNYPYFFEFFTAINALAYTRQKEQSVLNWLNLMELLLQQKSRRQFTTYLGFSNNFFRNGLLSQKGSSSWYLRNPEYSFQADTVLSILVEKASLVCASQRDSSIINNTSGSFSFEQNSWSGVGGEVDWWRFGRDKDKLFVRLKNYKIDLSQSEYQADSVTFYHKYYFDFPMQGFFQDKVHSSPPGSRTSYPRFSSYFKDYSIKNIFKGIDFNGGIAIEGNSLKGFGAGREKARLLFYKGTDAQLSLRAMDFVIAEDKIFSAAVAVKVFLGSDSLIHPSVQMRYDNKSRRLILFRSEQGVSDSPFFDHYHELDIHLEALYWDIDKEVIHFKQLEGMRSESTGFLESANFFSPGDFNSLRLIDDVNPMFVVENYLKEFGPDNEIKLDWYANFIKKSPEQAIAQLLRLASKGYLVYDSEAKTAVVKEKFFNTLKARAKESDYDVIRIYTKTIGNLPNLILELNDGFAMTLKGVEEVNLSEEQRVSILPNDNEIVFSENRDFTFSGFVGAGLFEFHAAEAFFKYDDFSLNLTSVDSLSFFVPAFNQKIAPGGRKQYVRVQNVISDMSGVLYIDQSDNKSGRNHFPQYPIFDSKNESYVFFEKPFINEGRLTESDFYYVVEPFEIDSLDDFSTDNLRFEGYLNSAGIFPALTEALTVMPDYSLGFNHKTIENYEMFSGKGFFDDSVHLSNQGFWGSGKLNYQTSTAFADHFDFYPDEVASVPYRFEIKEQDQAVLFPQGQSDTIQYHWFADTNMLVLETLNSPLILYNNVIYRGTAELSPDGIKGAGDLAFGNVEMSSDYFDLKNKSFTADTADFSLLTAINQKVAFSAKDYFTRIDFESRSGSFNYLDQQSSFSFPFNQYICTLDEASWQMDEDLLKLNSIGLEQFSGLDSLSYEKLLDYDLSGSQFISTHPDQDSLSFFTREATYDLRNYSINASGVKLIRVADLAVFPVDGKVAILEGARMETIRNAHLMADTANRLHHFDKVEINIFGRNNYTAKGYYDYLSFESEPQPVYFSSITPNEKGVTTAIAMIDEADGFKLSPQFKFKGKANILASRKDLLFDGGFQLVHFCQNMDIPWVGFEAVIDPANVEFPINKGVRSLSNERLYAGLQFDGSSKNFFGSFLSTADDANTSESASVTGVLKYDRTKSAYVISDKNAGIFDKSLELTVSRCQISGKGAVNLDLQIPMTSLTVLGNYDYFSIPDSTSMSVMAIFDFIFDEKLLQIMADSLNRSAKQGAALSQSSYLFGLNSLANAENFSRIQSEISLIGAPRKVPESLNKSLVFSQLKMSWDNKLNAFIARDNIGLANILRTQVNKKIPGYIAFEKGRSGDAVTIYLQPNNSEWYFFHYENGVMQALSSSESFNNRLLELKQEKRLVKDEQTDFYYEYVIGSRRRVVDFVRKMQIQY
ncbi:MAG: hypothetical protein M0Q90_11925 [Bacteroidales bacterium]|nr:hypothetical protein [Bacteroidales bacterium]